MKWQYDGVEQKDSIKGKGSVAYGGANKLCVSVGQRRDNFVLGSLITSSESLNESGSAITHGRGSCDTVKKYPWRKHPGWNQAKKTYREANTKQNTEAPPFLFLASWFSQTNYSTCDKDTKTGTSL